MPQTLSSGLTIGCELRPGNVYLIEERKPTASYELFDQAVSAGNAGMVVTRDYPKRLEEQGVSTNKVIWLTNMVGEGRINPTAIGILMGQVRAFIENNKKSVVMIDGLEYLISLNQYDRMLQFMHQLRDVVVTHDCLLLVPLDPRTLSQREVAMLERSMESIVPKLTEGESSEEGVMGHGEDGILRLLNAEPR